MSEETVETPAEETGKGLRAQLEKTLAENKTLKAEKLTESLEAIGLNESDGLGKAIAKEYSGEYSKDAIAGYAQEEYGHTFEAQPPVNPQAAVIAQGQGQVDAASQGAGSIPVVPTNSESLAKAEAEGDYATAMAIKSQQVADDLFKPRR